MGCNIDKMSIKGIRSFDPNAGGVIQFSKPLTLIVGHNGAGKTTVIECLKMVTCGELPPNTRSGQSFIHDPKIAGTSEVKAQIKLRFMTGTKQPVMVVRSFQLSMKKTSMQYKALDNTVQALSKETGQFEALSYRCGDIDKIVPNMMGVSKAVLENVIFVHQEESNWPLADGQTLKKKFDDIFAATRYTKALDELRKLKTKQTQEAKEMKLKLDHLKTRKDHAHRLNSEVENSTRRAQGLEQDIENLRARLETLAQEKAEVGTKLDSLANLMDDIKQLKAKHSMLASTNAESYARLITTYTAEDLELPIDELEAYERDIQPQENNSRGNLERLERELRSKQLEADALKEQYAKAVKTQGRLAAEGEAHARNVADRDSFIRKICQDIGISALAGDTGGALTTEALASFESAFNQRLIAAVEALDALRSLHQKEDDERGRAIDKLSGNIGGFAETLRGKQEQMRANDLKAIELQNLLDACIGNSDAVDAATVKETSCTSRLAAKEHELSELQSTSDTSRFDTALRELQDKTAALRSERERLASAAEQAGRMNYKAQELASAETKASDLFRRHKATLAVLLNVPPSQLPDLGAGLTPQVQAAIATKSKTAEEAAARVKSLQAKSSTVQGAIQATRSQLDKAKMELESVSSRLQSSVQSSTVPTKEQVLAVEAEREQAWKKVHQAETFHDAIDKYCAFATEQNACRICQRKFDTPAQRDAFLVQQKAERDRLPSIAQQHRAIIQSLEQKLAALKEVEPMATRFDKLKFEEIPALEKQIAEHEEQLRSITTEVELAMVGEAEASKSLADAKTVLQDALIPLDRLSKEIRERRDEVELLRGSLATTDPSRSVAVIDAELADLETKRAMEERGKQQVMNKLNQLREEVSALRDELHRAKEHAMQLRASIERKIQLEKQLAEINASSEQLAIDLVERQQQQEPLEKQRAELVQVRDSKRAEARAAEGKKQDDIRSLQTLETQFESRQRALREYEQRGGGNALEQANHKLGELQRHQEQAEAAANDLLAQLATAKDEAGNLDKAFRQVADILAYRRSKLQEDALATDIDAHSAGMSLVGSGDALQARFREIEGEEQSIRSEADRAVGALGSLKETADRARAELMDVKYLDIETKYRTQLIELRTTEMASGDLDKYHKALEKALLSFHTAKMADINAIVKELWQKTYRNTDIDYIQIKADTDSGAARSYNYRVVMSCGGAELDMRGRCSAGQKVLACLIIRLALAETFCLNCGILALDEPTTNLDAENSASLADSLRSIMTARKDQENFQLVVITHDEAFARQIGTREHTEYMWRIEKDENQHSTIVKEEILD